MHPIGQIRKFDSTTDSVGSIQWSEDMRICAVTTSSLRIMFPCVSAGDDGSLEIDDTFIMYESDPESFVDALNKYESNASAGSLDIYSNHGFRTGVWSPMGFARNGGCVLLSISFVGHVGVYEHTNNMLHGEYEMCKDVSSILIQSESMKTRDMLIVMCACWKKDKLVLGSKAGYAYVLIDYECKSVTNVFEDAWVTSVAIMDDSGSGLAVFGSSDGIVKVAVLNRDGTIDSQVTILEMDYSPVLIIKSCKNKLFIVKGPALLVYSVHLSSNNDLEARFLSSFVLSNSANISALEIRNEAFCYLFSQTGECAAIVETDGDWVLDQATTQYLHRSFASVVVDRSNDDDGDDAQDEGKSDKKESNKTVDEKAFIKPVLLNGRLNPKFMGASFSPNGVYLASCFDLSVFGSATFKPPADQKLSFAIMNVHRSDKLVITEIDREKLLYPQLWDIIASTPYSNILNVLGNIDPEVLNRIENFLKSLSEVPDNLKVIDQCNENAKCPICGNAFEFNDGLVAQCKEKHSFSRCIISGKAIVNFDDFMECLWCSRKRLKSSAPVEEICSWCKSSLVHNPI